MTCSIGTVFGVVGGVIVVLVVIACACWALSSAGVSRGCAAQAV